MFEVGFTEIVLIFGIALLVLGPARLPRLAADLGRWAGRARAMARQLRTQLEQEVQFDPLASNGATKSPAGHGTIHRPDAPVPTAPSSTGLAAAEPASSPVIDTPATNADSTLSPDATVPDERKPG